MIWQSLFPRTWNPAQLQWPVRDLTDLTDVWILVTVGVALAAFVWAVNRTYQSHRRTGLYLKSVMRAAAAKDSAGLRKEWAEAENLELGPAFNDLLVEVPKPGAPLERSLKRCGSASEVFNVSSLAHGLVGNRLLLAMPGILTGLGVLGTFVGLQIGIGTLDLEGAQIENLDKSIAPIIKGCSTAFATSVWGVVCSLGFTVGEKLLEWWSVRRIRELQRRLDALVPRYTPEESMIALQRASGESEGILKGLAAAIGDEMQKAMNRLGSSITEAVKESLGGQAQDLGSEAAKLMSAALTDELGKLQSAVTGMANGFKEEFMGASNQLHATVSGFEQVLNGVDETVKSSRDAMTKAVERLTAHEEVVKQLAEGSIRMKEAATELTSMRDTFTLSAEKNAAAATAQENAAAANEGVASKLKLIGDKLPEVQQAVSEGARVIASLGQPLLDLKDILGKTPEILGSQAEAQAERDNQRSSRLLEQTEKLAATVAAAVDKFAQIETLSESLADSSEQLQLAGVALESLASGIEMASVQHASAAKASERAAAAGERAATKLEPIPASLSGLTSTLTQAGNQIKNGAEEAEKVYGQLLEHQRLWLSGIETGLRGMKDRLQEILDAYGAKVEGATNKQMVQWNQAVEESLGKFRVQVHTLEGAINDLTSER